MKIRKSTVAAVALAGMLAVSPARAGVCPPFNVGLTVAHLAAVEVALKTLWHMLMKGLSQTLMSWDSRELAAMRVATSQIATAAKAQINANLVLKQGEMAAVASLETTKEQLKVYQEYSALTGQGVDPCLQLQAQANFANAGGRAANTAAATFAQAAAAPGRYGNTENYMNRMLQQRRDMFATEDEAKLGFGTAAKATVDTATGAKFALAGADTNAGVLFADSPDPRIKAAKEAYINHMGGAPDAAISKEVAQSPSGREYLVRKGAKDAAMSAALYSLAMVAAENSPNGSQDSKNQAMRKLVGQYYGNDAAARWKGWTSQSERGIMLDQMKIEASQLALKQEQYRSGQRLEVLLAAMLTSDAQGQFRPALDAAAAALDGERARPAVR